MTATPGLTERVRRISRRHDDTRKEVVDHGAARSARLFVFARHAESTANKEGRLNSDPARPVTLTPRGEAQAREMGARLAALGIGLAVCSSFPRARQTVGLALEGRRVPLLIDAGFDEVQAGDLDGARIDVYWA